MQSESYLETFLRLMKMFEGLNRGLLEIFGYAIISKDLSEAYENV